MIEKNNAGRIVFNILNYGFMAIFAVLCIAPIWHVLMASISNPRMLMNASGILWKPMGKATFSGYELCTTVAGYLVSRKNFKLQKSLLLFIMFTMMFSGGLIPTYMVIRSLGMINTRWVLMIPGMMNAFYIVMMKSAFDQLPESFEESAKLDGAGPLTILFRILVPLVKANIAVIIMFTIVIQWNAWYPASIYMPKVRDKWPLQLFMRELLIQNDSAKVLSGNQALSKADFTSNLVKYCVTVIGTLPILLVYPFVQKYFVKGVTLGGVKG